MGEIVKRAGWWWSAGSVADRALHGATSACGGIERVWCADFKAGSRAGMDAHRSADNQRCMQPLSSARAGGGEDGHERVRRSSRRPSASTDCRGGCAPTTVRRLPARRGRAVAAGGVVDQAGHRAGAHRGRTSEQNGRHERMHRTLKLELHPAQDWRGQQRELDRFRDDYNHVRPHERWDADAASVYEPSPREYPAKVPEPEYSDAMLVRSVKSTVISAGRSMMCSSVRCCGREGGLLPVDDESFTIYFAHMPLARFDSRLLRVVPLPKAATGRKNTSSAGACPAG